MTTIRRIVRYNLSTAIVSFSDLPLWPSHSCLTGSISKVDCVFNVAQTLGETDLYRISVHEIGYMLGLQHNSSVGSVMYFFDLDGPECLDPVDLAALAERHKLRIATLGTAVSIGASRGPKCGD